MSTGSSGTEPRSGTAAESAPTARPGWEGELAGQSTAGNLAIAAAAFADAFERWANRKATQAGASIPRLRLLYAIRCHGPQKMADLADSLAVTPRNVTALVDGLEAEGLVRRLPHSTDRRITLVELTCNSDRVAAQFQDYQASIASLFAGLDDTDQRTLLRLFGALHDRLHADAGCSTAGKAGADA
ncbi:MAG: MarR family transcriptional regulator [Candidatus Limnocylindrales bacterium]|jgi:DNA-binding MarR family transcriptional regulator